MMEAFPDLRLATKVTLNERNEEEYPRCVKWSFLDRTVKNFKDLPKVNYINE